MRGEERKDLQLSPVCIEFECSEVAKFSSSEAECSFTSSAL